MSTGNMGLKNFTALDITSVFQELELQHEIIFCLSIKNIPNDTDVKANPIQNSTFTLLNDTVQVKTTKPMLLRNIFPNHLRGF
jgi:hypothetical protein